MPKTYSPEGLAALKAFYFESRYISIAFFIKRFDPEFAEVLAKTYENDRHPLTGWEAEKREWLDRQRSNATNLAKSYNTNVTDRFDLMSYLQEKLISTAIDKDLDMLDLKRLVDIMDILSKIQDRTAALAGTVSNAAASSNGNYEEQKRRVDVLLKAALLETGIAAEGDKDGEID